ncbi:hypothetical protein AK830_g1625 [Neonectria ditissima]|uniref:Aminoglycoside phosphotransferase domain-containing protein n=1 Tax=Neonectria ditissima TaxID=78410 RepID=A0A0P7BE60_9HYPO|nr:hypothetical protein AK830_g1625 [Neonectria ditissima]
MASLASPDPVDFHGLKWIRNLWGSEPRWTVEPDENAVKITAQSRLGLSGSCEISFLGQGAFNRLYIIKDADREVVARVTLPVDPACKTLSEVATIAWVRDNTSLPVPKILAYDATRINPIGFEWIAMTKVPGKPLADAWQDMAFSEKEQLVRQLASFSSDTFCKQFRGIGSIFPEFSSAPVPSPLPDSKSEKSGTSHAGVHKRAQHSASQPGLQAVPTSELDDSTREIKTTIPTTEPTKPTEKIPTTIDNEQDEAAIRELGSHDPSQLQKMTSVDFIWDDRIHKDVSRGPFETSHDWMLARLAIAEITCRERLSLARSAESDKGTGSKTVSENGFAVKDDAELHMETTKEHDQGGGPDDYTGGEDSYDVEELEAAMEIISRLRNHLDNFFPTPGSLPEPSMILHDDMSRHNILVHDGALSGVVDWECIAALPLWTACQYPSFLQGQDLHDEPIKSTYERNEDGGVADLYWEHLDDFELTRLRHVFLEEMHKLQPRWVEIFESSQRQRDFDLAVSSCDDMFLIRRIQNWLDDMDSGVEDFPGLEERIDNASL